MKYSFSILLLWLFSFSAVAQIIESVGIKAGISYSNQTYYYKTPGFSIKMDYKTGLYLVATAESFRGKHLALSTEAGFVQKGSQDEVELVTPEFPEDSGQFTTAKITYSYLTFCPALKAFFDLKKLSFYVQAGPRLDFRVATQSDFGGELDKKKNKLMAGLNWVAGAEYKVSKLRLMLEFSGRPDFTPQLELAPTENSTGLKVTGKSFLLTTGLRYQLR